MDVHRLKFLPLQPKAINCVAFNSSTELPTLALARSDASIELWTHTGTKKDFVYQYTIPGVNSSSIECLKWAGKRLFSAGFSGNINEWATPTSILPVNSADVNGSSIWSLDINQTTSTLAVGCENGQVCLFDISYDGLNFLRSLDRQDERILSLSWHPTLPLIAIGSSCIKVLNTQSLHSSPLCITLDEGTLIWSVKFLSDNTIVSGSSKGRVDFWSSEYGTLKQSFSLHSADILTLACNDTENVIFASGVDHKIVRYKKVEGGTWVPASDIRPHTHDVRTLAVSCNGILVSGGIDGEVCFNKVNQFDKGHSIRHSPFTSWSRRFHIAPYSNMLLFQDDNSLKIWKINPCNNDNKLMANSPDKDALMKSGESLDLSTYDLPVFLLEIKSKNQIISSAISPNGQYCSFSSIDKLYMYNIKGECIADLPITARDMCISEEKYQRIAICDETGLIKTSTSIESKIEFKDIDIQTLQSKSPKKSKSSIFVAVQYSQSYLIVTNIKHRIYILDATEETLLYSLPRLDSLFPPLIRFTDKQNLLLYARSERELYSYELIEGGILTSLGQVKQQRRNHKMLLNMSQGLYTIDNTNKLCLLYDSDCLTFVKYDKETDSKRTNRLGDKRSLEGSNDLKSEVKYFNNVIYIGILECGQLVLVEKPWTERLSILPPTIQVDRYGN